MKRIILAAAAAAAFTAGPALAQDRDFDLEIVASEQDGVLHYAHNNETDRSAAIWSDGEDEDSARFMEGGEAEKAFEEALEAADIQPVDPDNLRIKIFGLSVYAEDDDDGDSARVEINAPGGDKTITVDARDEGDGDDEGVAHIVISGADEDGVRDFIDDIDDAPRSMKRDMEEALGL